MSRMIGLMMKGTDMRQATRDHAWRAIGSSAMMEPSPSSLRSLVCSSSSCCSARSRWGGRCGCGTRFSSRLKRRRGGLLSSPLKIHGCRGLCSWAADQFTGDSEHHGPLRDRLGNPLRGGHGNSGLHAGDHPCPNRHDYDDRTSTFPNKIKPYTNSKELRR